MLDEMKQGDIKFVFHSSVSVDRLSDLPKILDPAAS